ncbi:hypothetical protein VNO80_23110 [Phaseolus coccineus]|uniref:Uncharacterized protein n=1 Tax=Phaseolus coccineus TaxID=3886 RepID=A0AAN9M660_PHACN
MSLTQNCHLLGFLCPRMKFVFSRESHVPDSESSSPRTPMSLNQIWTLVSLTPNQHVQGILRTRFRIPIFRDSCVPNLESSSLGFRGLTCS